MIALAIVVPSESFKHCVKDHKNDAAYQQLHQSGRVVSSLVVRTAVRLRLGAFCTADFADKNERPLGAFAAIALAVFTFYLWHATRGLRRFAELQGDDMRRLVRLARANAIAGMRSSRAARTSAEAAMLHARAAVASEVAEMSVLNIGLAQWPDPPPGIVRNVSASPRQSPPHCEMPTRSRTGQSRVCPSAKTATTRAATSCY